MIDQIVGGGRWLWQNRVLVRVFKRLSLEEVFEVVRWKMVVVW